MSVFQIISEERYDDIMPDKTKKTRVLVNVLLPNSLLDTAIFDADKWDNRDKQSLLRDEFKARGLIF